MTVKQLSVFLENKTGRINQVVGILAKAGVNLSAFSIAENIDFGIMRIIVSDVEKAVAALKEGNFAVSLTDVVCLRLPNTAGSLHPVLELLEKEDVFIEYMYAFSEGQTASVVIRPTNLEKCVEIFKEHYNIPNTEGVSIIKP